MRLFLCDGRDHPVALELGLAVIHCHHPWAGPELATHFQVGTGDRQLPEFLGGLGQDKGMV